MGSSPDRIPTAMLVLPGLVTSRQPVLLNRWAGLCRSSQWNRREHKLKLEAMKGTLYSFQCHLRDSYRFWCYLRNFLHDKRLQNNLFWWHLRNFLHDKRLQSNLQWFFHVVPFVFFCMVFSVCAPTLRGPNGCKLWVVSGWRHGQVVFVVFFFTFMFF